MALKTQERKHSQTQCRRAFREQEKSYQMKFTAKFIETFISIEYDENSSKNFVIYRMKNYLAVVQAE